MSDTPRTDAHYLAMVQWASRQPSNPTTEDRINAIVNDPQPPTWLFFARELETELTDALRDLAQVRKAADEYRRENEMLKTEAAKLAESVRSLL